MTPLIHAAESGFVPDVLLRAGIRGLLRRRLRDERRRASTGLGVADVVSRMAGAPIATDTDQANDQHYELPAEFFRLMLGTRLKYSCCYWNSGDQDLGGAEESMLSLTCRRAGVADGMSVLDLGCGWGSLSLWLAERYPACRITAVSNSRPQQEFIKQRADKLGLTNIEVVQADVNGFEPKTAFDRVISIEMFEHMRNYDRLLRNIAGWLEPEGRLFVHLFCHRQFAYFYEDEGSDDWMTRHFFTGGVMPSVDLLGWFDSDLRVQRRWTVDGTHYSRTLLAWLDRVDARRDAALKILGDHYGADKARLWLVRWRLFLLACAELFGYRDGREWLVGHYLLRR